jgi:hypothetical protein
MNRASRSIRALALTAAVLLLWCHGLDASWHDHVGAAPLATATGLADGFAAAMPAHDEAPAVSCCFGGAGSNLLSVTLMRQPHVAAPLVATLLSVSLLLADPRRLRPVSRRHPEQRESLVAQSVLIRI